MYKKVPTDLNFVAREKEVEQFWNENKIFEKSMEQTKQGPTYTFYDGPPTANGKPHIGHVLTRVIKDMIPRYHTMKGEFVPRKAGWDTHGLPVELEVEKNIGINGKEQIEAYGLEPFIKLCKESVWKYKGMWEDFSGTVGFWADMEKPYVTYENDFIESEWWALKEIWNKDLLYTPFSKNFLIAIKSSREFRLQKPISRIVAIVLSFMQRKRFTMFLSKSLYTSNGCISGLPSNTLPLPPNTSINLP